MLRFALLTITVLLSFIGSTQSYNERKFHFNLSFPYVNSFRLEAFDTTRSNTGFTGIAIGVDYGDSLTTTGLKIGTTSDFFAPLGPVSIHGYYTQSYGLYANITRNHFIPLHPKAHWLQFLKKLELGYGIHGIRYRWKSVNTNVPGFEKRTHESYSLGLSGFLNVYLGKRFYVGYHLQPSFLPVVPSNGFKYQHVMSIEFGWRF